MQYLENTAAVNSFYLNSDNFEKVQLRLYWPVRKPSRLSGLNSSQKYKWQEKKYFYLIPQMGNSKYRNCSSFKVSESSWGLKPYLQNPKLCLNDNSLLTIKSYHSVQRLPSPGWQLVGCHKGSSAAECSSAQHSSQQSCLSLSKANMWYCHHKFDGGQERCA